MTTLKFADTHYMVAFLSKPTESEGFEQIVDFLNAHSIKHALMVNPTIYTSCIEQFWAIVKAKTVNGEVQFQALVDGKKIIITESTVRTNLQLEDADGVDCLPNDTIFEQLTLTGSKTTAWNEFSSTMASTIICLAINQKFNFSKYIFESMVKNLDNVGKFLMYPRNMRRVGKCFSGRETPLFQTMVVQDQSEMGKDEDVNEEMDDSLVRAATTATSLYAEQDRGDIYKTRSKATLNEPSSPGTSSGSGPRGNTLRSGEDRMKLKELMELCTNLQTRVLDLETTKTTQANEIASLKRRVKKLERSNKSRTHQLKRLYKVGSSRRVESSKDDGLGEEDAFKQGRIVDIDTNKDIYLETRSVVEEVTDVTIPVSAATTPTTTTAIIDANQPQGILLESPSEAYYNNTTTLKPSTRQRQRYYECEDTCGVKKKAEIKKQEQEELKKNSAFKYKDEERKNKGLPDEKAQQVERS
ncbi:hypothetical protein Tco_0625257 [Tanacetum coccineum]|uniref:Xylulose kinase-1 n=1 Tax=Tanacetum coccineum TaxID=301880 RepID=A0ABQ4WGF1_9ASTR